MHQQSDLALFLEIRIKKEKNSEIKPPSVHYKTEFPNEKINYGSLCLNDFVFEHFPKVALCQFWANLATIYRS